METPIRQFKSLTGYPYNEYMRTVIKVLLCLAIPFFTLPFVIFISIKQSNVSPETIKQQLVSNNIYARGLTILKEQMQTEKDTNLSVRPLFDRYLTPLYIQQKVETFLDNTVAWFDNKTTTPPIISFEDIADRVKKEHPELSSAFESVTQSPTASDFLKNPSISPGSTLGSLRSLWQLFPFIIVVSCIILVLCLLGILLLSTPYGKWVWMGAITLNLFFLYLLVSIGVSILLRRVANVSQGLTSSSELSTTFILIALSLVTPIIQIFKTNVIFLTISSFIATTIFFIGSFIMNHRASPPQSPVAP